MTHSVCCCYRCFRDKIFTTVMLLLLLLLLLLPMLR
jgi:hypothetical protein